MYFWLISILIKSNQQFLVSSEIEEKFYERSKLQGDEFATFKINFITLHLQTTTFYSLFLFYRAR